MIKRIAHVRGRVMDSDGSLDIPSSLTMAE